MERMSTPGSETGTEQILQLHIHEYQAIRAEINQRLGLRQELMNYGIAAVGGSIALFSIGEPSVAEQQPFVLLVASLLLSAISWALLEHNLQIIDLSRYVEDILVPKIQALTSPEEGPVSSVLQWETLKLRRSPRLFFKGTMSMGKYALTFIPSVGFLVVFYVLRSPSLGYEWSALETILWWMAVAATLAVPAGALYNLGFVFRVRLRRR